jgi:serine/threonine-protein kinase
VTGDPGPDERTAASAGTASEAGDESDSADSFLREVARAPDMSPGGSTLESSGQALSVLAPGRLVGGRFRIERKLGEGGMGVVWQAVHAVTRRPVALKVLKRSGEGDARAVQRFLREARAACAVRHPSVVEVHDVLQLDDGSPLMVMELLTGETFAQRLTREGTVSLPELARIMVHVCSAVGCAHALGIVHRDLKPENIFLAQSPSGLTVKVLDFGIAKLTASEGDAAHTGAITGTGAILGTPYYMAPEQLFGEKDIDHRADIWALGIIFYEALTGERPTKGDNVGQIYKVIMTDAIVPFRQRAAHLPDPFVGLVERMLSRDRKKRPPDVSAILSVLADYTNESFTEVAGPPAPPSLHDSADSGGPQPRVDSDTARASTVDAPPAQNRPGADVSSPSSASLRRRGPFWASLALVAASVVGVGGVVTWRARGTEAPAGLGANATSAVVRAVASSPAPFAPDPPTPAQPAPPQPVMATSSSPSVVAAPNPGPSARATAPHPRPLGASPKPDAATAAAPAPSARAASVTSRPPVDPGSYQ